MASFLREFIFVLSSGITDKVLSSSPNHIGNQWLEIITKTVPIVRLESVKVIKSRFIKGLRGIKPLLLDYRSRIPSWSKPLHIKILKF